MGLTINQDYLINFLILDLDAETATLVCSYYGDGLQYKEIAPLLYNECKFKITGGANSRIAGRLKRGREMILAADPSEADLENYPKIARTAILNIFAHYGPINDIDPKSGRSEVVLAKETTSKNNDGPLIHAEEIQEEAHVITPLTPLVPPKSCPRCSGNMMFEEDMHGAYSTCINCGYVYEFGAAELENEGKPRKRRSPYHKKMKL